MVIPTFPEFGGEARTLAGARLRALQRPDVVERPEGAADAARRRKPSRASTTQRLRPRRRRWRIKTIRRWRVNPRRSEP